MSERYAGRVLEHLRSPVGIVHGADGRCRRPACKGFPHEPWLIPVCGAWGHWRDTVCGMATRREVEFTALPPEARTGLVWVSTPDPIDCPQCLWVLRQELRAAEFRVHTEEETS